VSYSLEIISHDELDAERWDAFIRQSPQGSLYALHGYISSLRSSWQAYVVQKAGRWCAVMPFCLNKKWRFQSMPQPLYTQYWGICFASELADESEREQWNLKRKWTQLILDQWEDIQLVVQNFSPAFDYPLPFHWAGFSLHTRYTYYLDLKKEPAQLFAELDPSLRRQIRKSEKYHFQIVADNKLRGLLDLLAENRRQGHDIVGKGDADYQTYQAMAEYLMATGQGKIFSSYHPDGTCLAAILYAKFGQKGLYLSGAMHPDHKKTGAMSALLWAAIGQAQADGADCFDFEGSMLPGVEQFFRKFGAFPVPYLQIQKNHLPPLVKWLQRFT
jgi:hypothetical protein